MKEKKVFCEECREDVEYYTENLLIEAEIKGCQYSYSGKAAHCEKCGGEIYVAEINDSNLKALYDVFRVKNGIISLDTILKIPQKYGIGKRPLSLLLGWGEQTFSRYCDGDMPTKQYSEVLRQIYDNPDYYASILENNKENMKSYAAYAKSKGVVENVLSQKNEEKTKITLAIEYLLNECEDITPLALQKALYYVQGFFYAFHHAFIFSEDCEAWVHGPVYKNVYFKYKNCGFEAIGQIGEVDTAVFSSPEKSILDSVVKNICCYSGKTLESFTHTEKPWLETRGDIPINEYSNRIIPKELIGGYFSEAKEKYNMLNANDIKMYAQIMFEQI